MLVKQTFSKAAFLALGCEGFFFKSVPSVGTGGGIPGKAPQPWRRGVLVPLC